MKTTFKNRPVEILEIGNLQGDPVDAFIEAACWLDTDKDLTDEEMEALSIETDFSEECMEYQIGRAEDFADRDR